MNKLPWFTHDHDAHQDVWIRDAVRKQGHVAGWLWWVLLELYHKHGTGDLLKIDISDVAKAALTSTSVVVRVLTQLATESRLSPDSVGNSVQTQLATQSKLSWTLVGTELQLKIKKFRERQSKLKSNLPSTFRQPSVKTPLYREGEGEGEGEVQHTPPTPKGGIAPSPSASKPARALKAQDVVIRAYKSLHGIDVDDASWDKQFYKQHVRAAIALLKAFDGDAKAATAYVITKGMEYRDKELDWSLWAIHKAAGRDYKKIQEAAQEAANGQQHNEMGANRFLEQGRSRGITHARDLVGRTLAAIKRGEVEADS